ncbi:MAG: hypothetical protein V7K67_25790 [Nostoc sp.]|uniref:hypothetical protein n=1 Tax=Nostoc sp. TaxID=1180 RepID=UPI002FF69D60
MSTHPQIEQQITFLSTHNLNVSTEFYRLLMPLRTWDCVKPAKNQLLQPTNNQVSFLPW